MLYRSRKYYFQKKLINDKKYSLNQSIQLIKNITTVYPESKFNFDQSINITCYLSKTILSKINASKFKLYANLPYTTGKTMSIAVIKPIEAENKILTLAPNIKIYNEIELINNLENKLIDFDILYVPKERSKNFTKYKKILDSKGIILSDVYKTLFESKNFNTLLSELNPFLNKYSMDKGGTIQGIIGKSTFSLNHLHANLSSLLNLIKTHEIVGNFIKKITINSTMSPSIKLDLTQI
jgi:ribosomal protein L1